MQLISVDVNSAIFACSAGALKIGFIFILWRHIYVANQTDIRLEKTHEVTRCKVWTSFMWKSFRFDCILMVPLTRSVDYK